MHVYWKIYQTELLTVLIIRNEQLTLLGQAYEKRAEARMLQHVAEAYPEDYASFGSDNEGRRFIRAAVESAASRGILTETGVTLFVDLFVEYGIELERAPYRLWALRILGHSKLPEHLKLSLVRGRLSALIQGRRIFRFEPS